MGGFQRIELRCGWCFFTTLGFGAIGWVDDYRKVVYKNPKGLSEKAKFFWQSVIGLLVAVFLFKTAQNYSRNHARSTFSKTGWSLSGLSFMVPTYLVIVGTSNAVNLTDGLDGLAIMPTVMVAGALGILPMLQGILIFYLFGRSSVADRVVVNL